MTLKALLKKDFLLLLPKPLYLLLLLGCLTAVPNYPAIISTGWAPCGKSSPARMKTPWS